MRRSLPLLCVFSAACATAPHGSRHMKSLEHQLLAWSDDGASALVRIDEVDDGSRGLAYRVERPGEPVPPELVLAGEALGQRPRVTRADCVEEAQQLRELLAQRGFSEVRVDPNECAHPSLVVTVGEKASAAARASFLGPRPRSGPWFEWRGTTVVIGRGAKEEAKLFSFPLERHRVALSPSGRLLLILGCTSHGVCSVSSYVSADGTLAGLTPNFEGVSFSPAVSATAAPGDLGGDRAWWDASATAPRSPVEVSFDPEGQHPYSCVREDGAYWMVEQDDTGLRIDREGRVSEKGELLGRFDRDGALRMRGSPPVRLGADGSLFCRGETRAFARVDAKGVITSQASGERIGALHGDVDWRKNRRAAFLLAIDVCKLDQE